MLQTASASAMKSSSSSLVSIVPSNMVTVLSSFMSIYPSPEQGKLIFKKNKKEGETDFKQKIDNSVFGWSEQNTKLDSSHIRKNMSIVLTIAVKHLESHSKVCLLIQHIQAVVSHQVNKLPELYSSIAINVHLHHQT